MLNAGLALLIVGILMVVLATVSIIKIMNRIEGFCVLWRGYFLRGITNMVVVDILGIASIAAGFVLTIVAFSIR